MVRSAIFLMIAPLILRGQATTVRDSAGVRIVDNPSRLSAPVTFQLAEAPTFDVGGRTSGAGGGGARGNGVDEFVPYQGYLFGVRLSDGGLAAIDVTRIHYADANGTQTAIVPIPPAPRSPGVMGTAPAIADADSAARVPIGGAGAFGIGRPRPGGPEVKEPYAMGICRTRGDTIVVQDPQNKRLAVFDKRGVLVRIIPTDSAGGTDGVAFCFDDGTILLAGRAPGPAAAKAERLTRMRIDGTEKRTIGDVALGDYPVSVPTPATFVAAGQRLYYGSGTRNEVEVHDGAGTLLMMVRFADPILSVTTDQLDQRLGFRLETRKGLGALDSSKLARPTTWPAYGALMVDPAQRIWIEDLPYSAAGSPAPTAGWTAFDSSGHLLGRLLLPTQPKGQASWRVISFGTDDVLIRRTDADGSEHLSVFPIRRM